MPCVGGLKWADRPVSGITDLDVLGAIKAKAKEARVYACNLPALLTGRSLGAGALTCLIPLFATYSNPLDFYFGVLAVVSGSLNREAASPLKRKFPAKSIIRNTSTPEPAFQ